jgi:amidophosphoribosyltransferase
VVVVDDSIVRGNTQRAIVRMLREAGAVEVHVRISSPPVSWPCFYGIDFPTRAELLANGLDTDGIRRSIGADSLGYVSLAGLIAATEQPKSRLCRACFDGEYPIEMPAGNLIGKHVLEGVDRRVASDAGRRSDTGERPDLAGDQRSAPGAQPTVASPGGGDALRRP